MNASFVVPADHPCLPDHFPGRPLVPAVVILARVSDAAAQSGRTVAGAASARFLRALPPDERCEVVFNARHGRLRFRVIGEDGTEVARGELFVTDAREGGACA